jgi:hypothetical protein
MSRDLQVYLVDILERCERIMRYVDRLDHRLVEAGRCVVIGRDDAGYRATDSTDGRYHGCANFDTHDAFLGGVAQRVAPPPSQLG